MIYQKDDYVVVDNWRIGLIHRHFYEFSKRRYVVQFGAGGPFEQISPDRMRPASEVEARNLEVDRG